MLVERRANSTDPKNLGGKLGNEPGSGAPGSAMHLSGTSACGGILTWSFSPNSAQDLLLHRRLKILESLRSVPQNLPSDILEHTFFIFSQQKSAGPEATCITKASAWSALESRLGHSLPVPASRLHLDFCSLHIIQSNLLSYSKVLLTAAHGRKSGCLCCCSLLNFQPTCDLVIGP